MSSKLFISLCCTLGVYSSFGQGTILIPPSTDITEREHLGTRRIIPYTHLREADLQWEKRVWRVIDLKEKINHPLYFPLTDVSSRQSLIQVLKKSILRGEIIAFHDEEFLSPMNIAEVKTKLMFCDSVPYDRISPVTGELFPTKKWICDSSSIYGQIQSLVLMEECFFDKQKSVMEVRILGLSPQKYDENKGINIPLFWVYFPACRPTFANYEVFNTKNDAERRTFDDIFQKRFFNSYVKKESNVYDRIIEEYAHGVDALLESDRIKNDIFKYEHDLWHF